MKTGWRKLLLGLAISLFLTQGLLAGGDEIRPLSPAGENGEYVVGVDDVLEITVYKHPDLTRKMAVRPDGMITFDLAGNVQASGRPVSEIDREITERLTSYLRNPEVTVQIVEFNSWRVLVLGEVPRPGSYKLEGTSKLLDILIKAGWAPIAGAKNTVNVMREDGSVIRVDLDALLYRVDTAQNITLQKNDTIFVPKNVTEQAAQRKVTVYGEVVKPGIYDYPAEGRYTVKDLLLAAGGVSKDAAQVRGKIIRANGDIQVVNLKALLYDGDISQDYVLGPGDSLFVPREQEVEVYVLGMVQSPGLYVVHERPNVLQALTLARHYRFGAVLRSTKVVRGDPNNPLVISIDLERLLFKGDRTQNIRLESGDVLYIPQSFISSVADFITNIWTPMATTLDAYSRIRDVAENDGRSYYDPTSRTWITR